MVVHYRQAVTVDLIAYAALLVTDGDWLVQFWLRLLPRLTVPRLRLRYIAPYYVVCWRYVYHTDGCVDAYIYVYPDVAIYLLP